MRMLLALVLGTGLIGQAALARQATPIAQTFGTRHTCVSQINLSNPVSLPDGRVLFPAATRKGQSYAVSFKGGHCTGVRPDSRFIVVHDSGSEVCEGDEIRAFEPEDIIPGPTCIVDHFEPYQEPAKPPR